MTSWRSISGAEGTLLLDSAVERVEAGDAWALSVVELSGPLTLDVVVLAVRDRVRAIRTFNFGAGTAGSGTLAFPFPFKMLA